MVGHSNSPPLNLWSVFGIASLATFLVSIDSTILYAAFSNIAASFSQASPSSISWVMNAYTIVYATTLIPAGGMADRFGRKKVFMVGVALFTWASFLCGLAPNIYLLITARIIQAVGAAMIGPAALSLILEAFPQAKRAQVISAWGAVGALAAALGPASGTLIVDSLGWEWTFFINVPIGIYCVLRGRKTLSESSNSKTHVRFDAVGMALIILSIGLMTTSIIGVGSISLSWLQRLFIFLASGGVILIFAVWCKTANNPLVDLALFKNRTYLFVNLASFLFSVAFATMFFSFFFFMTNIWHFSLPLAGLAITPGPLMVIPVAILSGKIASKIGHRKLLMYGCLVFAAGACWYLNVPGITPNYWVDWLPGQILTGIAIGMVMPSLSAAAVHDLPKKDYAIGSSINQAIRQIGTVVGVAITISVLVHPHLEIAYFNKLYLIQIGLAFMAAILVTQVDTAPRKLQS
ncbi:DHA2 family efflux MFS transporter permease subunit [Methylobacillus gramineus]|uniref:DHA2 family efflux MFS transporter permease subunit n=1 Tax=Methylobacillus gramineus TaxID=755169 RepID=UPI001CFF6DBE|nr:DHA2 family efflux MFS transporter permease subunit [Methylobacillus gramineus]MCB5185319.1 DHA2 family efflux MFS transporter permease subunit [Methylobacillus gramineus]